MSRILAYRMSQRREEQVNPNWDAWEACVKRLRPGPPSFRWFLEQGDIDPNAKIMMRSPTPLGSAVCPPLCLLKSWAWHLWQPRPPSEGPFHRLWKRRRQQAMGLLPAAAAAAGADDQKDDGNEAAEAAACQPGQKQPRVAPHQAATVVTTDSSPDSSDQEEEEEAPDEKLQTKRAIEQLLELQQSHNGWDSRAPVEPLSPEEQRELVPLFPGGQELSAEELAESVRDSKSQLILELVLEDRVRTLLEFGADPNPELPSAPFESMQRELFSVIRHPLAAELCPPSVLRLLLEAKADPNWSLRHGHFSALCAHMQDPTNLRLLLEAGADPHHSDLWRRPGPVRQLTVPVESPVLGHFIEEGAPEESLRALLEYNPEICGNSSGGGETPMSRFVCATEFQPHIRDLVLKLAYPIPEECKKCTPHNGSHRGPDFNCWIAATDVNRGHGHRSPEFLRALVKIGYPTRGLVQQSIRHLLEHAVNTSASSESEPGSLEANVRERLDILESVTEEGQAQRRQEHLGDFWSVIMQAVPSLSGVVASLVLQAIVPEFQLRIA